MIYAFTLTRYSLAVFHLFDVSSRSQYPVASAYDISHDPLVKPNCAATEQ